MTSFLLTLRVRPVRVVLAAWAITLWAVLFLLSLPSLPAQAPPIAGYLGVKVVENAATMEDVGEHVGVRVETVVENSPAQQAGLRPGDVITALDGTSYDWPEKFHAAVAALKPGQAVKVEILRGDLGLALTVVPERRTSVRAPREVLYLAETERVGVKVGSLSRAAARAAGLSPGEGVALVGFWGRTSPWQRDGLRAGDLLHVMDGRPLHDPREFIRRIRLKEPGNAVTLDVIRDGKRLSFRTVASRRARRTERVYVPIFFNYRSPTPESGSWGVLLDVYQESWKNGKNTSSLFWVIHWSTGEAQELQELPVPPEGIGP